MTSATLTPIRAQGKLPGAEGQRSRGHVAASRQRSTVWAEVDEQMFLDKALD
jgi:hypothetical protein